MPSVPPEPPLSPVFQPLGDDDPRIVGGYRLQARLGAGGMGSVYLSATPGGKPIAVKVVRRELTEDPEFRRRFHQEVAAARRIHGLFTAQVLDAGPDDPLPWLATAYVSGPSLQQSVSRLGALPPRTVLLIAAGIAEALQAIHAAGVVHRDLKPSNVLLAADGPRVIDFGIARAADASGLTAAGFRIGSPAFMAPEQALGATCEARTDVFALGVLLAYAVSGRSPFGGGPDPVVLYRIVHEPPDLSGCPDEMRGMLARCLDKDPGRRPLPREVLAAVRDLLGADVVFGEGWLPRVLDAELTHRARLPETPTPAPLRPAAPTVPATPSGSAYGNGNARGVSRRTLALSVSGTAVLAAVTALVVVRPQDLPTGSGASSPPVTVAGSSAPQPRTPLPTPPTPAVSPSPVPAAPRYDIVYRDRPITLPPIKEEGQWVPSPYAIGDLEIDLTGGKAVRAFSGGWSLGYGLGDDRRAFFSKASDTTAAVVKGEVSPDACDQAIDERPVTDLPFGSVPAGRTICLRDDSEGDLAAVSVKRADRATGGVSVRVSAWHKN